MGDDTQATIAKRAGIAQSHVSRILRCEASATTDLLVSLSRALGRQPWELLVDAEATRQAALERMILGNRDDAQMEEAPRRKKSEGNRRSQ